MKAKLKVALIHDWLTGMRGGERCLEAFLAIYPEADIFTLIHLPGTTSALIDSRVKAVSFLNSIPGINKFYRYFLPIFPLAIRSLNLEGYDLVVSLSHAAAKNVRIPKGALHICYCFTPMRYIWDQFETYFGGLAKILWPIALLLRIWDRAGAKRVDHFVAISRFVAARIRCFYGRRSSIIHPPVDSFWFGNGSDGLQLNHPPYFLCAGALVPYKGTELVIRAFNQLGLPLYVVGTGPEREYLEGIANSNIHFYRADTDLELLGFYKGARALVFAAKEDFGIIPVECLAAGKPVIGLYAGGLKDSLKGLKPWDSTYNSSIDTKDVSGVFIRSNRKGNSLDKIREIKSAVQFFIENQLRFSREACLAEASRFRISRFFREWRALVNSIDSELDPESDGLPITVAEDQATSRIGGVG